MHNMCTQLVLHVLYSLKTKTTELSELSPQDEILLPQINFVEWWNSLPQEFLDNATIGSNLTGIKLIARNV